MNMGPPQAALDRLSSLSSLGDSAPERRSPGHHRQLSDSSETTGLVQRCVIIQKDQHGYGFTVSGDRIVLVQSVRPGGAAMRAGVQEGDRIVKVNGTMVTHSSHLEVVKLIKSGAYVALTLLGSPPASAGLPGCQQDGGPQPGPPQVMPACPPPPPPPPLPPPQRITGPKPLQDPEVQKHATQILRNMLRQEEAELQRCYEAYSRNPAALVEEQIEGARRRVSQLQCKIRQEMGGLVDPARLPSDSSSICSRPAEGRLSVDSQDGDSGLDSGPERFLPVSEGSLSRNAVLSDPGPESPHPSPVIASRLFPHHRRQGSDTPFSPSSAEQSSDRTLRQPLIIGPEEDYDPGCFSNECDSLFQDLGRLKTRPAHLGVFLRYLFSQADPSPLLLYLCVDVYQQASPKEARGLGRDLWHVFLDKAAPLRVKIPEQVLAEIDARVRNGEDARSAFLEAQEVVMMEIQEQIQDYRMKRTMGLGSLYGENDLAELDGDPQRERQVAEKQIAHLGDILSKYEEDRSAPMSFALNTYMSHVGLRPRETRPVSVVEKAQEKDKWLPFFPKTKKQSSSTKKDKEASAEDKKRNPILKYIGKPKSASQSTFHVPLSPVEVKPGNVRNIIQHFENNQHHDPREPSAQRLSTGSFPEDFLDLDGSRSEIKLGRSESLKGREELRRLRKAENVPRSRSDVDMEAAVEAARLHQSASSSASSLSARSLENPTPPYTPKMGRRSIESPNLGFSADAFLPHLLEDDLGPLSDLELEMDSQNWQHTVGREVVAALPQREIDRQEVINELFVTEASHLRVLRVLDVVFCQRMKKENLLSREERDLIFPNLPELIEIHNSLSEAMKKLREEGPVVREIGDLMLARFDGAAREEIQEVAAHFCAYQSVALELIKTKKRKETRFQLFMQEAESNPQCRRLQLKDLLISEMQRLTKYPLLLENVLKHSHGNTSEYQKLSQARDQCREILRYVNEAVRRAENQHRLEAYQKRLDTTSLERTSNPLAAEFKSLDLRSRRMIHEGPLSWRVSKDKTVDLHVLLLEDLLVLLQRQDEKLVLKCHSKTALGSSDPKQSFSPVLKLNSVLIRSVATDKRALFIICTSELGPQIYELVASTSSEKSTWMELLDEAVKNATRNTLGPPKRPSPELPLPPPAPLQVGKEAMGGGLSGRPGDSWVPRGSRRVLDPNPHTHTHFLSPSLGLQEAGLPSGLAQESCTSGREAEEGEEEEDGTEEEEEAEKEEEEAEEEASDETPTDARSEEKPLVLGEAGGERPPGGRGRGEAEEEEEEEEEEEGRPAGRCVRIVPSGRRGVSSRGGGRSPAGPPCRTLGSSRVFSASMAESALEDVETLRHLLLHSFLQSRQTEPHEELTPTPCALAPSQPWDPGEPPEEGGVQPSGLEGDGQGSEVGAAPHGPPGAAEGPPVVPEGPREAKGPGGPQVVRKAAVEGSHGASPLPDGCRAASDARGADGPEGHEELHTSSVSRGNYFYVSLPAAEGESHTEEGGGRSPPSAAAADPSCQPKSPPPTRPPPSALQAPQEDASGCPGPLEGSAPAEHPTSSQTAREVEGIFRTINQLTLKLARLKDLEVAHQQLLRSLAAQAAPLGELPSVSGQASPRHPQEEAPDRGRPLPSPPSLAPAEPGQAALHEDGPREVTL
ncbi:LOW QUALITY PROTEIN: rho guanine nucleotide exchange factor 11 [Pogona vitticeps]